MEQIKNWALGVTAAAIIGAVVLVITPKGSIEKTVRVAVSLFLMCALLNPFVTGIDFSEISEGLKEVPDGVDTSDAYSAVEKQTEEAISDEILKICSDCGIKNAAVNIDVRMNGENNLSVESVEISAESEYEPLFSSAEKQLEEKLGIKSKIGVRE